MSEIFKESAAIERLEIHGPKDDIISLKAIKDVGGIMFELDENAVRRTYCGAKPDKQVSLHPYFRIQDGKLDEAKELQARFYELTKNEKGMLYYGFSHRVDLDDKMEKIETTKGNIIHCREGYESAEALLEHLKNVDEPLNETLKISELERLECHGPVSEIAKLRSALTPLGCEFYESDLKGSRK